MIQTRALSETNSIISETNNKFTSDYSMQSLAVAEGSGFAFGDGLIAVASFRFGGTSVPNEFSRIGNDVYMTGRDIGSGLDKSLIKITDGLLGGVAQTWGYIPAGTKLGVYASHHLNDGTNLYPYMFPVSGTGEIAKVLASNGSEVWRSTINLRSGRGALVSSSIYIAGAAAAAPLPTSFNNFSVINSSGSESLYNIAHSNGESYSFSGCEYDGVSIWSRANTASTSNHIVKISTIPTRVTSFTQPGAISWHVVDGSYLVIARENSGAYEVAYVSKSTGSDSWAWDAGGTQINRVCVTSSYIYAAGASRSDYDSQETGISGAASIFKLDKSGNLISASNSESIAAMESHDGLVFTGFNGGNTSGYHVLPRTN